MTTLHTLIERFKTQLAAAEGANLHLANACSLATVDAAGRPRVRMVLLKDVDTQGFVFYTNMKSRKARELTANPHASLLFWWGPLEQQVSVGGTVSAVDDAEADAYFATRPRGSQLAAWASQQSAVLASRDDLMAEYERYQARYEGQEVPRPPHWSGYRLAPDRIEFWYGAESRLHERREYVRSGDGWTEQLLNP